METKKALGREYAGQEFRIQVSPLDCTGCGNCYEVCPAKTKALEMKPLDSQRHQEKNWEFAMKLPEQDLNHNLNTVKGAQFKRPLFEFSGACAGCGETPYEAGHPAVRRPDDHRQRHRLLLHLRRLQPHHPLRCQQQGPRPRLGQQPV